MISPHAIGGAIPVEMSGTLDRAVAAAARDAMRDGRSGAAVLLSPACASFDHYPNFEVRGDAFRALVGNIAGCRDADRGHGMTLISRSDRGCLGAMVVHRRQAAAHLRASADGRGRHDQSWRRARRSPRGSASSRFISSIGILPISCPPR